MKKFLLSLVLLASVSGVFAQNNQVNPYPRTINVTGSAEMELVPDQVYVQVTLKEYQKKGSNKVNIDQIRQDFLKKFKTLGLPDTAISILDYDGFNGNPWEAKKRKKDPSLLASISYQIMLRNGEQIDRLVSILDDDATANFQIIKISHSKLEEYRRDLKVQAIQAAKAKAIYLAAAINEKVGPAVSINEPNDNAMPMYKLAYANTMMRAQSAPAEDAMSVDFKKIKIQMEVNITFALL